MKTIPHEAIDCAILTASEFGIPASVTLAQYCLESDFGERMPPGSNNPFGIKATGEQPAVSTQTHEVTKDGKTYPVIARFRRFNTLQAAFDAHARLLADAPAYAKARAMLRIHGAIEFAHCLTGVYATDPLYGDKLEMLIEHYNLLIYDHESKQPVSDRPAKLAAMATVGTLATAVALKAPKTGHFGLSLDANIAIAVAVGFILGFLLLLLIACIIHFRDSSKVKSAVSLEPFDFTNDEDIVQMIKTYMQPVIDQVKKLKADSDALAQVQNDHGATQEQLTQAQTDLAVANSAIAAMKQDDTDTEAAVASAAGIDPASLTQAGS